MYVCFDGCIASNIARLATFQAMCVTFITVWVPHNIDVQSVA
jgi:hypothetical protein